MFYCFSERFLCSVGGKIENSSIGCVDEVVSYGTVRYYFPVVDYSYRFCGEDYKSSKVAHDIKSFWFESKVDAAELLERIHSENAVYVSKQRPGSSVLLKGLSARRLQHHCIQVFSGLFFVVVAAFFY